MKRVVMFDKQTACDFYNHIDCKLSRSRISPYYHHHSAKLRQNVNQDLKQYRILSPRRIF